MTSVQAATKGLSCAIRLSTPTSSLLLDVGDSDATRPTTDDRLILLSHVHADHSGGLCDQQLRDLPFMCSEVTAHSLLDTGRIDRRGLIRRARVARPGQLSRLSETLVVEPFAAPHCPGSLGYRITDGNHTVFFTGDVLLTTARHDFLADFIDRVANDTGPQRTVLLDATMGGRTQGATGADAGRALLDATRGIPDVIICASDASQLLYAYLDLFAVISETPDLRHRYAFLISHEVRRFAQLLHDAFITRRANELDPLLSAQYGKAMSSWAESRSLFWLDTLQARPLDRARVWFVLPADMIALGLSGVGVGIGRVEPRELPLEPLAIDTTPWTQHSCEDIVIDAVHRLAPHARVLLFHRTERQLRRFISDSKLPAEALQSAATHL
ncbi:MAG TPA: MBL fold metallo-hydrolase [Solirubrobacteraceae bacterium]|nr:MBL fold metallo-hydrolase [Solirubrobacteraceae bacterium]